MLLNKDYSFKKRLRIGSSESSRNLHWFIDSTHCSEYSKVTRVITASSDSTAPFRYYLKCESRGWVGCLSAHPTHKGPLDTYGALCRRISKASKDNHPSVDHLKTHLLTVLIKSYHLTGRHTESNITRLLSNHSHNDK